MIERRWIQKGYRIFFAIALLICVGGIPAYAEELVPDAGEITGRVLFISSYSYAWETVPEQICGIKEALGDGVQLDYQFMDTKNVETAESEQLFYQTLAYYLKMVPAYDVVIVGDDAAFQFAMTYRDELFAQTPVVFEGVNDGELAKKAAADPLVTGVVETLSYENTITLAKKLYPDARQVVGILDDTVTGEGERKEFQYYDTVFPELDFVEIDASKLSQEELKRQVAALGEESILVYIMCSRDGDGNVYAAAEAIQMLSDVAQIPMFSIVSHGMGKGFLGGEIVSQEQMGKRAGEMAVQILEGTDCAGISIVMEPPKVYCFDENVMRRFGISASKLPGDAVIINHRETFWEKNRDTIRATLVIAAVALAMVAWLAVDNMRRRKMNEVITRANEKLSYSAHYDVLTHLKNRSVFMEDIRQRIVSGEEFTVFMYDLDNFKRVNDTYGHNTGDEVLREVALRSLAVEDGHFTPYRLAGDEFVALIDCGDYRVIERYASGLMERLQKPCRMGEADETLGVSLGIAVWPEHGADATELLAAADAAMYTVKKNGKNGYAFYKESCAP